ncbi:MAG: hypothetical protein CL912_14510 [Deltaproteobacteria bacterium]|nr:hypothetical protein [Deltaproteobacteria bacterium]
MAVERTEVEQKTRILSGRSLGERNNMGTPNQNIAQVMKRGIGQWEQIYCMMNLCFNAEIFAGLAVRHK